MFKDSRKRADIDGSKFSAWQVLAAANAYYALSARFTDTLPRMSVDVDQSRPDMDAAAASATNRLLALELYLKALLIGDNAVFKPVHDLKKLFDTLPPESQAHIERRYNERLRSRAGLGVSLGLMLNFRLVDTLGGEFNKEVTVDPAFTLSEMLQAARDGFVASRYLFEKATYVSFNSFHYDYVRLGVLCGVICEELERNLPFRHPDYTRAFSF